MAFFEQSNQKSLINGGMDLDALGIETNAKLESLAEKTRDLEECRDKIGTAKDTKQFREKMKKKITSAGEDVREASNLLHAMDEINLTRQPDITKRAKLRKRLDDLFNERVKKFTDLATQIAKKESTHVENIRKASMLASSPGNGVTSSQLIKEQQKINEYLVELDYNEQEINERQKEIDDIVKITYAIRDITANLAQEVHEQGETLEVVIDNIKSSKDNANKAVKELNQATKYKDSQRKTACTLFICVALICAVIVTIVLVTNK